VTLDQLWFVIEEVEMASCACHEKMHDAFGFRWMMEFSLRQCAIPLQHCRQRQRAEAAAGLPEEFATRW